MSDTTKRIIYPLDNGGVAIVVPAENCELTIDEIAQRVVPENTRFQIINASDVPTDKTFRDAWTYED